MTRIIPLEPAEQLEPPRLADSRAPSLADEHVIPPHLAPERAVEQWRTTSTELDRVRVERKRKRENDFEAEYMRLKRSIEMAIQTQAIMEAQAAAREQARAIVEREQREKEAADAAREKAAADAQAAAKSQAAAEAERAAADEESRRKAAESETQQRRRAQFASLQALQDAAPFAERLAMYKATVPKALAADRALFNFCFLKKMAIRTRVGQIANVRAVFVEKADAINAELAAARARGDTAYQWLLNYTAKQLLAQAQTEAAVNRAIAFALAHVALLVMAQHPDFVAFFMARLYKRCLIAVPQFPEREAGTSDADYLRALRYRHTGQSQDGQPAPLEDEEKYAERMAGMVATLAALVAAHGHHPWHVPASLQPLLWQWPARLLNLPPRRITPIVLLAFLEIAGAALVQRYGRQAVKLVHYILRVYLPRCPASAVAATTRCRLWLQKHWTASQVLPQHPDFAHKLELAPVDLGDSSGDYRRDSSRSHGNFGHRGFRR